MQSIGFYTKGSNPFFSESRYLIPENLKDRIYLRLSKDKMKKPWHHKGIYLYLINRKYQMYLPKRISSKGRASAFQAEDAGSSPAIRFI